LARGVGNWIASLLSGTLRERGKREKEKARA
jgi:hypothetical protein